VGERWMNQKEEIQRRILKFPKINRDLDFQKSNKKKFIQGLNTPSKRGEGARRQPPRGEKRNDFATNVRDQGY